MTRWTNELVEKTITPEQIGDLLHSNQRIYIEQGAGEPLFLIHEVFSHINRLALKEMEFIIAPVSGINQTAFLHSDLVKKGAVYSFYGTPQLWEFIQEGIVQYVPINVTDITPALQERFTPQLALLHVTPPNRAGFMSFGVTGKYNLAAAEEADVVLVQVNEELPFTAGNNAIHISEVSHAVLYNQEPIQVPAGKPGAEDEEIARYVADLIPDGATIQLGLGKVPNAIIEAIRDKKDLGIHSGLLSDPMVDLMDKGVFTGRNKERQQRRVVATTLYGTTDILYRFCHQNPLVEIHPASYTHAASTLSCIKQYITINSAIEMDLFGQANAELVKGRQVAGIGGQMDFSSGARLSPGGRAIIALPSTAKGHSRIISFLKEGTPVTTPRTDIDYVVTEYGVAQLRYASREERISRLIAIAHPDHRQMLLEQVQALSQKEGRG